MTSDTERFQELMSLHDVAGFDVEAALKHVGELTDLALDLRSAEGVTRALELAKTVHNQELTDTQRATLHYFEANAWSSLGALRRHGKSEVWDWEQVETEKQIIHLRWAMCAEAIPDFLPARLCQIYTNLGNTLSHIGRFVEAIEFWKKTLATDPAFGMALGNLGQVFYYYGYHLYDAGHRVIFARLARYYLVRALSCPLHTSARQFFSALLQKIKDDKAPPPEYIASKIDIDALALGTTEAERRHRLWCLENRLFLNPLNDLANVPNAARDILTTPNIVVPLAEGPSYQGFFNQLKQEYVSARYLYYEGSHAKQSHFSDRDVLLYNTLDYPAYGVGVEKTKVAFRMTYSLFDKVAYFLNDYLGLKIPERGVNFRTLWYVGQDKKKGIRPELAQKQNWPFRGLFWLAKDLYDDTPGFREATDPDSQRLKEVRDQLEHKYLKLHTELWPDTGARHSHRGGLADTLAYSVNLGDFQRYAVNMLHLGRAALIYLSLGIHAEERRRAKERGPGKIVQMPLDVWEDDWKV